MKRIRLALPYLLILLAFILIALAVSRCDQLTGRLVPVTETAVPPMPTETLIPQTTLSPLLTPTPGPVATPGATVVVNLPQIADGANLAPRPETSPTAYPYPNVSPIPTVSIAEAGDQQLVHAEGQSLVLQGQPYVFVGVNATYLTQPYFPEDQLESVLSYLSGTGGVNAVRLFYEPGHDPERLEQVLDIGGKLGIRFVVTLQDYYFHKSQHWFAVQYRTEDIPHVTTTVSQFRDRPEILAWELMNEPGCGPEAGSQDCADLMYAWAQDVSLLIKTLDPNHLVSVGSAHRMWTDAEQENYDRMHALDTVDIISIHRDATDEDRTEEMALAERLNKPVFIGEAYYLGYDEGCGLLYDGILRERAEAIGTDLARSLAAGADGYLLWQHDPGRVIMEDDRVQWFCGQHSFLAGDPVYAIMAEFLE